MFYEADFVCAKLFMLFDVSDIKFPPIVFFSLTGRSYVYFNTIGVFFNSSVNLFPTTRLSRGFLFTKSRGCPLGGPCFDDDPFWGGRRLFVGKLVAVVDRSLGGGLLAVLLQLPRHPQEGVGQLAYQLPMGVLAGRAALQPPFFRGAGSARPCGSE